MTKTFSLLVLKNVYFVFLVLASSGIDYDVKIWAPLEEESIYDEEIAHEVGCGRVYV